MKPQFSVTGPKQDGTIAGLDIQDLIDKFDDGATLNILIREVPPGDDGGTEVRVGPELDPTLEVAKVIGDVNSLED